MVYGAKEVSLSFLRKMPHFQSLRAHTHTHTQTLTLALRDLRDAAVFSSLNLWKSTHTWTKKKKRVKPFLRQGNNLSHVFVFSLLFAAPQARYVQAKLSVHDRSLKVATVIESLEMEMELLCLTGVEDQLQTDVRPTLEILRNAGIKVWAGGLLP